MSIFSSRCVNTVNPVNANVASVYEKSKVNEEDFSYYNLLTASLCLSKPSAVASFPVKMSKNNNLTMPFFLDTSTA